MMAQKGEMFMFCKYCGAKIFDEGKFCPECGIETQDRRCFRCAKPLPYGARYCDKCGELVADQHWTWEDVKKPAAKNKFTDKQIYNIYCFIIVIIVVVIALVFGEELLDTILYLVG